MDLAKLVIAAAWIDGELQNEEINALKDLLFNLEDVTGDEWSHLEIYMDSPVSTEEKVNLLRLVMEQIKSEEDKELVVSTLENLVQADGVVTEEEIALLEEVKEGISDLDVGLLARVSKMIKSAVTGRDQNYKAAAQRESQVNDYIENNVYYQLKAESEKKGIKFDLPSEQVKKLCLAAGLLARISAVDSDISEAEIKIIKDVLSTQWNLSEQQAQIVTQTRFFRLHNFGGAKKLYKVPVQNCQRFGEDVIRRNRGNSKNIKLPQINTQRFYRSKADNT
jgi:uncharacterized tellurite resistance protein B-like protein